MLTGKAGDIVLREYEAKVLDAHHLTLPFEGRDRPTAIYALLAQHDSYAAIELLAADQRPDMGYVQIMKSSEEGLSQAVRWLHDGSVPIDPAPTSDWATIGEAGEYAKFAGTYVDLADMHRMYGRKQLTLEVDDTARRVKFNFEKDDLKPIEGYIETAYRAGQSLLTSDRQQAAALFRSLEAEAAKIPIRLEFGRIIFDDISALNDSVIREMTKLIVPSEELLLPAGTDLLGFSVDEFERYVEALRRWSFCATFLYISAIAAGKCQQNECMPTQVVPRATFLTNMGMLSGLPQIVIEDITRRLAYDNRTAAPDIFQQPLVCGPQHVVWSARVIERTRHLRNLLKLMARTPALQNDAATIIGSRDRAMLIELGKLFSEHGGTAYKIMVNVEGGGQLGDIDLLAFNLKHAADVLIVEGKALLGVDEINEVDAATKEMQHAQTQLAKVIQILQGMPEEQKRELFKFVPWGSPKSLHGLVVAQDAEPNDKYDHSQFPGISLATIKSRMHRNHFANPLAFWTRCKNRPWLEAFTEGIHTHRPVKVGDVTYLVPAFEMTRAGGSGPSPRKVRRK